MNEKRGPAPVPSAIGLHGIRMTTTELAGMESNAIAALRIQAVESRRKGNVLWKCPSCGEALYPHRNGTPHWQHFPNSYEKVFCVFGCRTQLSQRQLEALLYKGRQKGELHEDIVGRIVQMLQADPLVARDTIATNEYETPLSKDHHGRFPDVVCQTKFGRIVFEVQTSPIFLFRIIERQEFYKQNAMRLIWVTDGIEDLSRIPSYLWDILAVQGAVAYEIPRALADEAVASGRLFLHKLTNLGAVLKTERVGLHQLSSERSELSNYWLNTRDQFPEFGIPKEIESILLECLELTPSEFDAHAIRMAVDCLLSIETGYPVGYHHENVAGVLNSVLMSETGRPLVGLFEKAIQQYRPDLFETIEWLPKKIAAAREHCNAQGAKILGRNSWAERLRKHLFPNWDLGVPAV